MIRSVLVLQSGEAILSSSISFRLQHYWVSLWQNHCKSLNTPMMYIIMDSSCWTSDYKPPGISTMLLWYLKINSVWAYQTYNYISIIAQITAFLSIKEFSTVLEISIIHQTASQTLNHCSVSSHWLWQIWASFWLSCLWKSLWKSL